MKSTKPVLVENQRTKNPKDISIQGTGKKTVVQNFYGSNANHYNTLGSYSLNLAGNNENGGGSSDNEYPEDYGESDSLLSDLAEVDDRSPIIQYLKGEALLRRLEAESQALQDLNNMCTKYEELDASSKLLCDSLVSSDFGDFEYSSSSFDRALTSRIQAKASAISELIEIQEHARRQLDSTCINLIDDITKVDKAEKFYSGFIKTIKENQGQSYIKILHFPDIPDEHLKDFQPLRIAEEFYRKKLEETMQEKLRLQTKLNDLKHKAEFEQVSKVEAKLKSEKANKARLEKQYFTLIRNLRKVKRLHKTTLNRKQRVYAKLVADRKVSEEAARVAENTANAKTEEVEALTKQVRDNLIHLRQLEGSIIEAEANLKDASNAAKLGKSSAKESKELLVASRNIIETLGKEKAEVEKQSSTLEEELKVAKQEMEVLKGRVESQTKAAESSKSELDQATTRFKEALEAKEAELKEKHVGFEAIQKRVSEITGQNEVLGTNMESVSNELQKAKELNETELLKVLEAQVTIAELEVVKQNLEKVGLEKDAKVAEIDLKRAVLDEGLTKSQSLVEELQVKLQSSVQSNATLLEQINNSKETNAVLQEEADKVVGLQKSIAELNQVLEANTENYRAQLLKGQKNIKAIQESKQKVDEKKSEEIKKILDEMEKLRETHESEVKKLKERKKTIRSELRTLKETNISLKQSIDDGILHYQNLQSSSDIKIFELESQLLVQQEHAQLELDLLYDQMETLVEKTGEFIDMQAFQLEKGRAENEMLKLEHEKEMLQAAKKNNDIVFDYEISIMYLNSEIKSQAINKEELDAAKKTIESFKDTLSGALESLNLATKSVEGLESNLKKSKEKTKNYKAAQKKLEAQYKELQEEKIQEIAKFKEDKNKLQKLQKETEHKLAQWKGLSQIAGESDTAEASDVQQKITTMLNEKDTKISELNNGLQTQVKEREKISSTLEGLNKKYDSFRSDVGKELETTVDSAETIVRSIGELKKTLAAEISAKNEAITKLESDAQKGIETQKLVKGLQGEIKSLGETKASLDKAISSLQEQLKLGQEKHADQSSALRSQMDSLNESIESQKMQMESMKAEKAELVNQMQIIVLELEQTKNDKDFALSKTKEVESQLTEAKHLQSRSTLEVNSLESQLQDAKVKIREKEEELRKKQTEKIETGQQHEAAVTKLQSDIGLQRQIAKAAQTNLSTAKETIGRRDSHIIDLKAEMAALYKQINAQLVNIANLTRDAESKKTDIAALQKDIQERNTEIQAQAAEIKNLREQIDKQKKQLIIQSAVHAKLVSELQGALTLAQNELKLLESSHGSMVDTVQKEIADLKETLVKNEQTIKSRAAEQAELGKELDTVKSALGTMTSELGEKKQKITKLKEDKNKLQKALAATKLKNRKKVKRMEKDLEGRAEAKAALKSALQAKSKKVLELKAKVKQLEADNSKTMLEKHLKKTVNGLASETEVTVLQQFLEHLKEYKGHSETDLDELKRWYREKIVGPKLVTPEIRKLWAEFKRSARSLYGLEARQKESEMDAETRLQQLEAENRDLKEKLEQQRKMSGSISTKTGEGLTADTDLTTTTKAKIKETEGGRDARQPEQNLGYEAYRMQTERLFHLLRMFPMKPGQDLGLTLQAVEKAKVETGQQIEQVAQTITELEAEMEGDVKAKEGQPGSQLGKTAPKMLSKLHELLIRDREMLEEKAEELRRQEPRIVPSPSLVQAPKQPHIPNPNYIPTKDAEYIPEPLGPKVIPVKDDDGTCGPLRLFISPPKDDCEERLLRVRRGYLRMLQEVARLNNYINTTLRDLMNRRNGPNYIIQQVNRILQSGPILNPVVGTRTQSIPAPSDDDIPTTILQDCSHICTIRPPPVLVNACDVMGAGETPGSEILAWCTAGFLGATLVGVCSWYWFVLRIPAAVI